MQINEVIRKYRKENHLTQEEMAKRLGVSTPAVNKWESGSSMPDITLLAPIARLLHISLDELLSFKDNLSDLEIRNIVKDIDERFEKEDLGEVFKSIKELVREYPNCDDLILSLSCMMDAQCILQSTEESGVYDNWIKSCYELLLNSDNEQTKLKAADCLYGFYLRKEEYEKAEGYLDYFSIQNPERKRKLATIYSETGRFEDAYKALEEVVFSEYQIISGALHGIYMIAMKIDDHEKAESILDKLSQLCDLFDMGAYNRISIKFDYYVAVKNASKVLRTMDALLENTDSLLDFTKSDLFEHMEFKKSDPLYLGKIQENLLEQFRSDESYEFVRSSPEWIAFEKKWYSGIGQK